jgi:Ca-activated chloride channel family protein
VVAPPTETKTQPAKLDAILAANAPGPTADDSKLQSTFDAVKSAPDVSGTLQVNQLTVNNSFAHQSAAGTFARNDGSGSSAGAPAAIEGRQTQMRATEAVTAINSGNLQLGASAPTGGGYGGNRNYQNSYGKIAGTVNAPQNAGEVRGAVRESWGSPGSSPSIGYEDEYAVAQGERSKLMLGDEPAQDRFYRLTKDRENNTATYPRLVENSFLTAVNHPLSTFSIDVDTASYANVRRFLTSGQLPPPEAVRLEEMINYFKYDYPKPRGNDPFTANIEIAGCPWNSEHRLVRIGLKGREIAQDKRPPSNFVFLIDVSGSMQPAERLPLIKQALRQLVKKMTENDRVAIVVYASEAGVKLESTSCAQKEKILEAIDQLHAGGSTAGAAGIQTAYEVAQENFIRGGANRVLLCTDGDFNVGITDQGQLVKMIQDKAKSGVFLTTLGVGTDNYKDALMQKLADKGNGNYAYLDTLEEAQKVLIDQMSGTLVTIAKDVKIQVEFNPAQVGAYRLIGYEKRMLRKEDFNNDKKDAGEIGAGHTVTALYEIVPAGVEIRGEVDDLKYQRPAEEKAERYVSDTSKELLTLKLRYKQPDGAQSRLLAFPVTDSGKSFQHASTDFRFATAVAEFGMLLCDSQFMGDSSYRSLLELAESAKGTDAEGYRSEFLTLVKTAQRLAGQ